MDISSIIRPRPTSYNFTKVFSTCCLSFRFTTYCQSSCFPKALQKCMSIIWALSVNQVSVSVSVHISSHFFVHLDVKLTVPRKQRTYTPVYFLLLDVKSMHVLGMFKLVQRSPNLSVPCCSTFMNAAYSDPVMQFLSH